MTLILRFTFLAILFFLSLHAASIKTHQRTHAVKRDSGFLSRFAWTAADLASARKLQSGKLQQDDFVYGTVYNTWQKACLGKAQTVADQTGKPVHAYYVLNDETTGFIDLVVPYLFELAVICGQTTKEPTSNSDYGDVVADWTVEVIGSLKWDKTSATTAANKVAQQLAAGSTNTTGKKTKQ